MKTEWSNKDSLEIPEITAGYGSVSWSDYKTGTSCDSVVLPTVKTIPIELYEQVRGERDVAVKQLKALNIELFEKPYRKAIPVEWIEKYAKRFIELENRNYFAYRGFSDVGEAILNMLENWEKENGTEEGVRNI